ncbi:MAG: chlorohydrolase family protein [Actinomycetaceae bacterium]|nr:chlorohydrolase family protein [Actinomycetaceae bacterium]
MVTGRYVIGWKNDDFIIYRDGAVVFEGDTITYVGKASEYQGSVDEVIDSGNSIVSPGLIDLNALGDVDHHLIFSDFPQDRRNHLQWSMDYFDNRRKEDMSAEDEAFKSLYAYTNLIMNGVTTAMPITSTIDKKAGETYEEMVAAAEHAQDLGLRVYLGPSFLQGKHVCDPHTDEKLVRFFPDEESEQQLANAERFIQEFEGAANDLIRTCVVPERIELQTEYSIRRSKEIAQRYKVPIRMHATQGIFEYDHIMAKTGLSPVKYLDSLGFFDDGAILPHGFAASGYSKIADQSDDDLDILRDRGVSVLHCPIVFARMGIGLESFGRYIRHGINMCMGTDTWPADILENCKTGSLIARILDDNRRENYFDYFFKAATIGGAKALGRDDIGRLAPGCKADIVIFDQSRSEYGIQDDPIQSLFNNGYGMMVSTSIINGRVVMRDRQLPGINQDQLLARAQLVYDHMKASYKERSSTPDAPDKDFFHTTFPIDY